MALQTTNNGQVVRRPPAEASQGDVLAGMLKKLSTQMAKALPKHVSPDRMNRIALTALRSSGDLQKSTTNSFLGCVLSAAQLGLEVNTPLQQAYLIPRKNSGTLECTLLIGYQGMLDLARRSGEVSSIYAELVYKCDEFVVTLGLERDIKHIPSTDEGREDQPITHVYGVAKLKSGDNVFVVLTRGQIEKYRQRGGKRSFSPWDSDFEAMAKKTAIRRLFTWMPKSAEMAQAAHLDEAPELGKSQQDDWDPSVAQAFEAEGIPLEEQPHDKLTGETANQEGVE